MRIPSLPDLAGPTYEKYLTFEPDDPADSPAEHQNEEETETDVDDTEATEDGERACWTCFLGLLNNSLLDY